MFIIKFRLNYTLYDFYFVLFSNRLSSTKIQFFLLTINFFYILNCFDVLILKITFKK